MLKFSYFTFFVLACWACQTAPKPAEKPFTVEEKTALELKKTFIEEAKAWGDAGKFRRKVYATDMTQREAVELCRQVEDNAFRSKMIYAFFSDKEFNSEPATPEHWAAYRFNLNKFVETVSVVRHGQTTFMDVGSGNGEKLFGALCLGFQKAIGLEYSPKSVQDSQRFLRNFKQETEIVQGDALAIEGSFYQKADFIYMYSPIREDRKMARLFKRIMDNMREGSVLLEVRCVYIKELIELTQSNFPEVEGWLAVMKHEGKLFYKNIVEEQYGYTLEDGRHWRELRRK